jgi:hypothetical protein
MTTGFQVVLDACVLVNAALRDTLLRLAEPPELYLPRWSDGIVEETTRTLEEKLNPNPGADSAPHRRTEDPLRRCLS